MLYRHDIDGLRAIAVIAVILSHVQLLPGGYIGVDVFFVISGFLIAPRILNDMQNNQFMIANFYIRRAKRLLPQLFLMIAICFIAAYILFLPVELKAFGKSAIAAVLSVSNFYFLSKSGYFAPEAITQPLLHTWSLAVEEQFYILIPVIIYFAIKTKRPLALLSLLGLISLVLCLTTTPSWTSQNFYLLPFRTWEFIAGALVWYAPKIPSKLRIVSVTLGLLLIVLSAALLNETSTFPGVNAVAPVLGTMLIIWAGPTTVVSRTLSLYPMKLIGRASYSLYIWHWPIIVFYSYYSFGNFTLQSQLFMIGCTLFVGFFFWFLFEEPIRNSKATLITTINCTIAAVILIIAASGILIISKGVPARLNNAAKEMASSTTEISDYLKNCITPVRSSHFSEDLNRLCKIGIKEGKPTFALWGDSFSAAIAYGLSIEAEKLGLTGVLLSVNSCRPLIGTDSSWEPTKVICQETNENAIKVFNTIGIKSVFMHAEWTSLNNDTYVKTFITKNNLKNDTNLQNIINATFLQTAEKLKENGITPIMVEAIPSYEYNIVQKLTQKHQISSNIDISKLRSAYDAETERSRIAIRNLDDVKTLRPADILCDNLHCSAEHNGKSVTYDGGHITTTASEAVGSMFSQELSIIKNKY